MTLWGGTVNMRQNLFNLAEEYAAFREQKLINVNMDFDIVSL